MYVTDNNDERAMTSGFYIATLYVQAVSLRCLTNNLYIKSDQSFVGLSYFSVQPSRFRQDYPDLA